MDAAEESTKLTPEVAPFLSIGPVNHENAKGKPIDLVATISSVLVEPKSLQKASNETFSNANIQ